MNKEMMSTKFSLEGLHAISVATGMELPFRLLDLRAKGSKDYQEFIDIVNLAIDSCVNTMAKYPKELYEQSEDQLSIFMIGKLEGIGLRATHDTTSGGHCDIVIQEGNDLLWLGEAKRVTGKQNAHIEDGYLQLFSRYATGLPSQDHGGLIIFCCCERIDQILESWKDHISVKRVGFELLNYDNDRIELHSQELHPKTGRNYNIRHKPISIYWHPQEREKLAR